MFVKLCVRMCKHELTLLFVKYFYKFIIYSKI